MSQTFFIMGLLFWCGVAFLGTANVLKDANAHLHVVFGRVRPLPGGLFVPVVGCYVVASLFLAMEFQALRKQEGIIGLYFMASVISGIIASICLAGLFNPKR